MRYRNLPVVLAAAAALAVLPAISSPAGFGGAAQAGAHGSHGGGPGGGHGGGPGGDVGTASSHGMDTAAAAVSPETSGLYKAEAVLETTPASDEAKDAVDAAIAEQENDLSFGAALDNMASDVRSLLAAVFGSSGSAE